MSKKGNDDEIIELTEDELSEILRDDDFDSEGGFDEIPTFQFSNSDPYAKVTPRSEDASKRDFSFDENGNIVVKNLSAFWLPDVKIVEVIGGTEYTVTGSYDGEERLNRKLKRIMDQNATDDENDITEDGE